MSQCVLFITNDIDRAVKMTLGLERRFAIEYLHVSKLLTFDPSEAFLFIIDVDLSNFEIISRLNLFFINKPTHTKPKIFILNSNNPSAQVQAGSLGASKIFFAPVEAEEIEFSVKNFLYKVNENYLFGLSEKDKAAFQSITDVNDKIFDALEKGGALPKEELNESTDLIIQSLEETTIHSWLDAVKEHHSYTHRHCMTVMGLAIAFGQYYKMRKEDVNRLAIGALVHDIGKVRIPLRILDKPGKLTDEERKLIETHPLHSSEILIRDGQFDSEIIDVARHHHELLDGSGYPDGLSGSEISDLVRIMTIIDIFSALIDQRAYKTGMPKEKAYNILLEMEGKLDSQLLMAFKPIAFSESSQAVDQDGLKFVMALK